MSVHDIDKGWGAFRALLRKMKREKPTVEVGVFDPDDVVKAAVNEFGSPANNIPARPFLSSAMDTHRTKHTRSLGEAIGKAVDRTTQKARARIDDQLEEVGALAVADIRRSIETWSTPPNEESTIEEKGEDRPLVDTGSMRDSVEWRKAK